MPAPRLLTLDKPPVITGIGLGIHHSDRPEEYCSSGRWRLHLYTTPVTMRSEEGEVRIAAGWAALWPPEAQLDCRYSGRSVHICAHFQLDPGRERVAVPALQDLGARFSALETAFLEAARWFELAPHRAEARLWDLLWSLADQATLAPAASAHPSLERAREFIHAHLHQDLSVERIAEAARCSANHLLRLFRRELGTTVVGYVRDSRVRRAEHLLRHSGIPIKEIAAEVGIPDLHFFNKVVRSVLGVAPREVRAGRGERKEAGSGKREAES